MAHNLTDSGGLVSRDFTEGYGPEEYVLRKAVPGNYKIKAHYFGSHQQTICGPCTVTVTVFTNYGRSEEKKQVLTLRLEESGDDFQVGEITIEGKKKGDHKSSIKYPSIEDFRKIKIGMNMDQIVELVGIPHQVNNESGNGILMLTYSLVLNMEIRIEMKYEVIAVRQIMKGVVVELL